MKTFIVALTLTIAGISSSVLLVQAAAAETSGGGSKFQADQSNQQFLRGDR